MTRTTAREIAVQLGFSLVMTEQFADELLDEFFDHAHYESLGKENPLFAEYPEKKQMEYIRAVVQLIFDHRVELDAYIEKYSKGWKVGRISKTAAAINEAVELAKGYEDEDVVAFINGVLGGFIRGEVEGREEE